MTCGNSHSFSASLTVSAGGIVSFWEGGYLLSLIDWRIAVTEEDEALVHSSKTLNNALKTVCALLLLCVIEYGMIHVAVAPRCHILYYCSSIAVPPTCILPLAEVGSHEYSSTIVSIEISVH
jgi:hypothetical protein